MSIASDFPLSVADTFTATREQIVLPGGMSYLIRRDDYPNPICIWNYHPEWEIHFIPDAQGFAYVGDYIGPFKPGHLMLTGTNLPHNWITPGAPHLPGRDLVLQFDAEALMGVRAVCPEFDVLHRLKPLADRGIEIMGPAAFDIGSKILDLHALEAGGGLGLFIEILNDIEAAPQKRLLASEHFISVYNQLADRRHRRIDHAIQIMQSSPGAQMHEVAKLVGLAPSAFSRAFRRLTGMNFSAYSRSVRVWRARTLLAETEMSITDICFEAGFNNLSNFNRYFRTETGLTPRSYRNAARIRAQSMIAPGSRAKASLKS
ncbi:AraC family transcriptional regulator [Phyllobacterium sp. 0TCS1.6C]|uniref:AraC family transcriptional regulator n=1 Tax=unclassified Phyllobacterium TaxID=2638441 RepID=UPI002264627B|nr:MULTISPECIES: AraC family transcriptional regulator [unclassified Phyllobacterium]MCX8280120.1 AraC family transcriptional regulator [Phyllobacterium sp. 0TCS1.6C]MCX8294318.1 AraC family transcriptional regulator [Phyllobacterium sp. 0TCS1.6A]